MTLYYTIVFFMLMLEIGIFMLLIVPLPFTVRRKIFTFISESPIIAKVQYGMKITFIFILILFIDSVNRVYRVQLELSAYSDSGPNATTHIMGHERTEVQARKFYSQRNMYLCGFTLFLSLILNRTYTMILDILHLEEKVKAYESTKPGSGVGASGKTSSSASSRELEKQVQELKDEVERKGKEVKAMKSQAEGLHREYDSLADKYAEATGETGGGKKDS